MRRRCDGRSNKKFVYTKLYHLRYILHLYTCKCRSRVPVLLCIASYTHRSDSRARARLRTTLLHRYIGVRDESLSLFLSIAARLDNNNVIIMEHDVIDDDTAHKKM